MADAPEALPRLRQLVLDLAVRGKLLPQQPGDHPQAKALAAARSELSERAKATGRLRFTPSAPIAEAEIGDELPTGWVAARINDTGLYINGLAFKPSDWKASGLPIIRIQNLSDDSREFNYAQGEFADEVLVRTGDILVSWSATLDAYLWKRQTGVLNQHIFRVIQATGLTDSGYLLLLLKRAIRDLSESVHAHGLVMTHINRGPFLHHVVWIPPLAEQHRIVAKVDELMALCDRLEAARAERETARDRLTAASLARLNTPDPETFADDARFALDALPALTTRCDQITQMRQTILGLAVRGKLVGQDPRDEPASDLLTRVSREIDAYCKTHRLTRAVVEPIEKENEPYTLPLGWRWARLAELHRVITDGDHQPPPRADEGIAFLTIGNVTTGKLNFADCRLVSKDYFQSLPTYRVPAHGDILYTVVGATFGRPALVDTDREFCVQRHIAILKPASAMNLQYLVWMLSSPHVYDQAIRSTTGTAQPTIGLRPLRHFAVPVPPLVEQGRIVAKVAELMRGCDQLEASLSACETHRARMLEVLLRRTLEPTDLEWSASAAEAQAS
ncbi:MAG: restriction endonuclease subunit S [Betaproteobacteria bacterium]|nr:restriction endonuclease subunit S [Betaproteobacteria bacterium]